MPTPLVLALVRQLLASGAGKEVAGSVLKGIQSKHITSKQAKGLLEKLRNPEVSTKEVLDKKTIEQLMRPAGQSRAPGADLPDDWDTFLLKSGVHQSKRAEDAATEFIQPVSTFSKIADKGKFPKPRVSAKEKEKAQLFIAKMKNKADIANLPKPKPAKPKKVLTEKETEAFKAERAKALKEIKVNKLVRESKLRKDISQQDAKAWLEEAEHPTQVGAKSIYQKIADAHNTNNKPELNRLLNELAEKKAIASGELRVKSTKPLPEREPPEPEYGSQFDRREYARAQETWEEKDFTLSKYRLREPDEAEVRPFTELELIKDDFNAITDALKKAAGPYRRALERFTKEDQLWITNGLVRFTKKQEPDIYRYQKLLDMEEELKNIIAYRQELLSMPERAAARDAKFPFYSHVKGGYELKDPIKYYITKSGKRIQINEGRKWTAEEVKEFYERQIANGLKKHDEQQKAKKAVRRAAVKKKAEIAARKADEKAGIVREKPKSQLMTKEEYEAAKKNTPIPEKKNTAADSSKAEQLTEKERAAFIARIIGRNLPLG